jgi:hypothetical protein
MDKCKSLRQKLKEKGWIGKRRIGNFFQCIGGMRFSGLYRCMRRGAQDSAMPGLQSYFSRRRDGIPVPTLGLLMKGYRNQIAMAIPSKTLETAILS